MKLARGCAGKNQHYFSVKTIVTTFALSLALCAAAGASAQTRSAAPASAPDSVLLSEHTDGNYLVRKYIVNRDDDNGYSIRYQINMSRLVSTLADNSRELSDLNGFVESVMNDTLMRVKSVQITGYSSPDGPLKFNETLARNRAADFKNYVDRKYGFSKKYKVSTSSVAEDWETCRMLVDRSDMADRQAVLRVIDGTGTPEAKEQELKAMPAAWEYMKVHILPPLRRVEMTVAYDAASIVELRTMNRRPEPQPEPQCDQPQQNACEEYVPCEVIDESITGIIVEMPDPGVDFEPGSQGNLRSGNHTVAATKRMYAREDRAERRAAKQEARELRKLAKKEAKAAKKAEKAARKAMK